MAKPRVGLAAGVGVLLAAIILFVAWIVMLLVNVVLSHYNVTTLDYTSALAVTLLLTMFGAGTKS